MKIINARILTRRQLQKYLMSSNFTIVERLKKSHQKSVYELVGIYDNELILIERKFTKKGEYLILK